MILQVYIDEATAKRLAVIASETGRSIEDLAECAVSEAALESFRHRRDDPSRQPSADRGANIVMQHTNIRGPEA